MKKNILIIILIFIVACTMLYAFIKANEAKKAAILAHEERSLSLELQKEAERQRELALDAAAEAKRQQTLAEEAMAMYMECKNK